MGIQSGAAGTPFVCIPRKSMVYFNWYAVPTNRLTNLWETYMIKNKWRAFHMCSSAYFWKCFITSKVLSWFRRKRAKKFIVPWQILPVSRYFRKLLVSAASESKESYLFWLACCRSSKNSSQQHLTANMCHGRHMRKEVLRFHSAGCGSARPLCSAFLHNDARWGCN